MFGSGFSAECFSGAEKLHFETLLQGRLKSCIGSRQCLPTGNAQLLHSEDVELLDSYARHLCPEGFFFFHKSFSVLESSRESACFRCTAQLLHTLMLLGFVAP